MMQETISLPKENLLDGLQKGTLLRVVKSIRKKKTKTGIKQITRIKFQRVLKVANVGVGVNTVAALLKYGIDQYDVRIFANTGSETPDTYEYLYFLNEIKHWNIIVVSKDGLPIYDFYFKKKSFPVKFKRDCTQAFKIVPMKKYLRRTYGKNVHFLVDLFIDAGEFTRMSTSDVTYETLNYPLVYDNIDRKGCEKIIIEHGFPMPSKSGCFFCPFNSKKRWLEIKEKYPELHEKSEALEKNAIPFDGSKKKLKLIDMKMTLRDGKQSCMTGFCSS